MTYDPAQNNVFSGPNGLIDYFNPDKNAPLPLVELPANLNPYYNDGVRIYAKMLTALPATNVKSLPGKYPVRCVHFYAMPCLVSLVPCHLSPTSGSATSSCKDGRERWR